MVFCNPISPNCDTCFEVVYGNCNDVLTLSLGLDAATTYFINLTDKFDVVTPLTVLTDGSGDFTITQTWTEFFGGVEVDIFADSERTILISIVQNSKYYNCVLLVKDLSGQNDIALPAFDTDAQAYYTASSIIDIREQGAVNNMLVTLKDNGLFTKLTALYLISPTSLAAAAVNAKTPGTFDITWVNSPVHSANGVLGNGTTRYGRTGVLPNVIGSNDFGFGIYNRTSSARTAFIMGSQSAANRVTSMIARTTVNVRQSGISSGQETFGGITDARGWHSGNRDNSATMRHSINGVQLEEAARPTVSPSTFELYLLANNAMGVAASFDNKQISGATIGTNLTAAEDLTMYIAMQTYQTNVIVGGREV